MEPDVTRPQLAAVTMTTTLMLLGGLTLPSLFVNMRLSARDVAGSIMPPGMITGWDTPGESMRDMAAVHPRLVTHTAAPDAKGDNVLEPRMENGVKVFELETSVIRWNILPDVHVEGYAFNGQIPGPRLRVTEGDRVRVKVTNHLPESTTVHWHGLIVPNGMDGPAGITQAPIPPGGTFTYEFTTEQAGTFFYHTHDHVDRQQALGLYGALIIDPKNASAEPKADKGYVIQLQEWLQREGLIWTARKPGKWLVHCHIPHHTTNNNVEHKGGGGLIMVLDVEA